MKIRIALLFMMLVIMAACSSQIAENLCLERREYRDLGEVWDDELHRYVGVFEVYEYPPEIIGGLEEVRSHLVYPPMAVRVGVEGTVKIQATVNEQGDVVKAEVIDSLALGCSEAAAHAVSMVKFIPACHEGKPIQSTVTLPVRFRLIDNSKDENAQTE